MCLLAAAGKGYVIKHTAGLQPNILISITQLHLVLLTDSLSDLDYFIGFLPCQCQDQADQGLDVPVRADRCQHCCAWFPLEDGNFGLPEARRR